MINFCDKYIRYRITVPKHYVTYMGSDMGLLQNVYYKQFFTNRYIRVGEVEKKAFLAIQNYWMIPFRGYKKKKLALNGFKETYWVVKLRLLSYKLKHRYFSDRNTLLMVVCFHKKPKLDLIYLTQCRTSTVTSSFTSCAHISIYCCNEFSKSIFWLGVEKFLFKWIISLAQQHI